jgi:hypothetical protein
MGTGRKGSGIVMYAQMHKIAEQSEISTIDSTSDFLFLFFEFGIQSPALSGLIITI